MKSSIGNTSFGLVCGVDLIRIDAIPPYLPQQLPAALLSACTSESVWPELCLLSDAEIPGRLQVLLILRAHGTDSADVARRAAAARTSVLRMLGSAGFSACALPFQPEKEGDRACVLDYNRRMDALPDGVLCFAGEDVRSRAPFYVPSGYMDREPFDLCEITAALARHPGAAFCMQFSGAELTAAETDLVRSNRAFFAAQRGEPAATAARVFSAWENCAGQPLCFLTLSVRGNADAITEISGVLRRRGLVNLTLPAPGNYLLDGALSLCGYAASAAHRLAPGVQLPAALSRLNHMLPAASLPALIPLPAQASDLTGVTINRMPQDHEAVPEAMTHADGLLLGHHFDTRSPITLPLHALTRHGVLVGMPGSGKTTRALGMLYELWQKGIPFIAVEPTKTEYRSLMDVIPELQVYTPGRSSASPMGLNPFLPPKGVTLEQFMPSLITIFEAAFSMTRPLDVVFPEALRTCYTRYGWRADSTRDSLGAKVFGLHEFIRVFRETVQRSGYDAESKANLESGGIFRLQSLLNDNPLLYDTERTLPFDELLKRPTVIELDAVDNTDQKSLIMSLLLINLMLTIRHSQPCDGRLRNVLMIDEAHLLLGRPAAVRTDGDADPAGKAALLLQDMTVAIRAYGTGLIFADQSAEKLTREVVSNANLKIMFRQENARDRRLLADNTSMRPEIAEALPSLPTGQAYLYTAELGRTVRVTVPDARAGLKMRASIPDSEVHERAGAVREVPFARCAGCAECAGGCDAETRVEADFIARSIVDAIQPMLADRAQTLRFLQHDMNGMVDAAVRSRSNREITPRLTTCARIHLLRRVLLASPCALRDDELEL